VVWPRACSHLLENRPDVADRTDVPELVRVADRADRLDLSVADVERQRRHRVAVPITQDRAGLAVHLVRDRHAADVHERAHQGRENPGDPLGADEGISPPRSLAASVADQQDVPGEQVLELVELA